MTKFWNKKPNKQDLYTVKKFIESFDVKLTFTSTNGSDTYQDKIIRYDLASDARSLAALWSVAFHELMHVHYYRNYKFYRFHHDKPPKGMSMHKYMLKYGLRVERAVDRAAMKLMKVYLPGIPFRWSYKTNRDTKWHYEYINKSYSGNK